MYNIYLLATTFRLGFVNISSRQYKLVAKAFAGNLNWLQGMDGTDTDRARSKVVRRLSLGLGLSGRFGTGPRIS